MKVKKICKKAIPGKNGDELKSKNFSQIPKDQLINMEFMAPYNQFTQGWKPYVEKPSQLRNYLAEQYALHFPEKPYPERKPMLLVRMAIGYKLLKEAYEKSGIPVPEKVKRNAQACAKFNPVGMEATAYGVYSCQPNSEELSMKTNKVVKKLKVSKTGNEKIRDAVEAKAKTAKPTVAGTYIAIFDRVAKGEKLSDAKIAGILCSAFPDKKKYGEADVRAVRSLYNNGKISGQKSKPKAPIVEFVAGQKK